MSAGAFSDPKVIQASERVVCIFVDCDWGKKSADLAALFKVQGYPTVVLCEPDGKRWGTVTSRDPDGIAKHIHEIADKGPAKAEAAPRVPQLNLRTLEEALPLARKHRKPVLLFFSDESPATLAVTLSLTDGLLKETLDRFVLAKSEYRKGSEESTRFSVTRAPTILVLNSALKYPEEKILARIEGSRSARELQKELAAGTPEGSPAPVAATPTPEKPSAEALSDDEVDRRFIEARVRVALDHSKQDRKEKALAIYEDLLKTYPKHVLTEGVRKLRDEARK